MTNKQQKQLVAEAVLKGNFNAVPEGIGRFVHVIKANTPEGFIDKFNELKSDEERTNIMWNEDVVQDIIKLEPEYNAKSSTEAKKFRQFGNKYFQKKAYLTAIKEYSKSIMQAPRESTIASENELALAYANRSAALLHVEKYELCLKDIEFSLEEGYPKELQYKLFDRQGKCFSKLCKKEQALEAYQKAKDSLQNAKLEEKYLEIWKTNLQKDIAKAEAMSEGNNQKKKEEDPLKITHPVLGPSVNANYPNISKAVDIECSKEQGRYGVASQDIRLGEVLMVNKPYGAVLYEDFHENYCYNCFQKALAPVPCPESSSVMFCSRECRDYAWKIYQQWEYKFMALFESSMSGQIGHLALRLVFEGGVQNVLSYVKGIDNKGDLEDPSKVGTNNEGIYESKYSSIYHMFSHTESRKPENLFDLAVMACFLLKILKLTGALKQGEENLDTEENLKILGGVLMRHLQIIQCNGHEVIIMKNPNNFQEPRPGGLGMSLYPSVALLNHACDPVTEAYYYGNTAVVRATRNIDQGAEVSISYGPTYYDDDIMTRLTQLKANHFFDCKCTPCTEEWPLWLEMDNLNPMWLCHACGNVLLNAKMEDKKFAKCRKCSHRQNMEEVLNNLSVSHDIYSKAMAEALSERYENALPGLIKHLELQQKCIAQPWRDYTACQVAVKHCFALLANVMSD